MFTYMLAKLLQKFKSLEQILVLIQTMQNKTVNLTGYLVTSANILW